MPSRMRFSRVASPLTFTVGEVRRLSLPVRNCAGAKAPDSPYRPSFAVSCNRPVGRPAMLSAPTPRQAVQVPSPVMRRSIERLLPRSAGTRPFAGDAMRVSRSKRFPSGSASSLTDKRSPPRSITTCRSISALPDRISARPCTRPLRATPLTGGASSSRRTESSPM